MSLDLGHFKKIKEDLHSATLKHPKGHEITVQKSALSDKLKSQLATLPHFDDGGQVDPTVAVDPAQDRVPANTPDVVDPIAQRQEMLKQMQPGYYASFPDKLVEDAQNQVLNDKQAEASAKEAQANALTADAVKKSQADQAYNAQASKFGLPQRPVAQEAQAAPAVTAYAPPGMGGQPQTNPLAQVTGQTLQGLQKGYGLGEQGIREESAATKAEGQAEAQALQSQAVNLQKLHDDSMAQLHQKNQEIDNTIKDIQNGHIDPDHYINSKSTLGKVASAIGLILGGIGGGLTRQENPALKFLNDNIQRDVQAQVADLGRKENILSAYFKQTGNIKDAMAMTGAFYTQMTAAAVQKAAAEAKSPLAKAQADKLLGQLEIQKTQQLAPVANRQAILGGVQGGHVQPAMAIQYLAPEGEKQHLMKDLQDMQNVTNYRDKALEAFDKIRALNTPGNRTMSPVQASSQIEAIKGPLVAGLSKETAGRFTEQDARFLDKAFSGVLDNDQTAAVKRQQIENLFAPKMAFPSLTPYGIKPPMTKPRPR